MSVRFQADADLNHIIVKATLLRREPSMDFQTAHAAGLVGIPDPEVLALAAHAGRVLVTHDRKTMPPHFAAFIRHTASSGVIVIPQKLPIRRMAQQNPGAALVEYGTRSGLRPREVSFRRVL